MHRGSPPEMPEVHRRLCSLERCLAPDAIFPSEPTWITADVRVNHLETQVFGWGPQDGNLINRIGDLEQELHGFFEPARQKQVQKSKQPKQQKPQPKQQPKQPKIAYATLAGTEIQKQQDGSYLRIVISTGKKFAPSDVENAKVYIQSQKQPSKPLEGVRIFNGVMSPVAVAPRQEMGGANWSPNADCGGRRAHVRVAELQGREGVSEKIARERVMATTPESWQQLREQEQQLLPPPGGKEEVLLEVLKNLRFPRQRGMIIDNLALNIRQAQDSNPAACRDAHSRTVRWAANGIAHAEERGGQLAPDVLLGENWRKFLNKLFVYSIVKTPRGSLAAESPCGVTAESRRLAEALASTYALEGEWDERALAEQTIKVQKDLKATKKQHGSAKQTQSQAVRKAAVVCSKSKAKSSGSEKKK